MHLYLFPLPFISFSRHGDSQLYSSAIEFNIARLGRDVFSFILGFTFLFFATLIGEDSTLLSFKKGYNRSAGRRSLRGCKVDAPWTIGAFLFVLASHATHIAVPANEFIQLSIVHNIGAEIETMSPLFVPR